MAEFGMKSGVSHENMGPPQSGGGGANVEWFSAASAQQYASYTPQAQYGSSFTDTQGFMGGGGNGSFEDEPPLLEGQVLEEHFRSVN